MVVHLLSCFKLVSSDCVRVGRKEFVVYMAFSFFWQISKTRKLKVLTHSIRFFLLNHLLLNYDENKEKENKPKQRVHLTPPQTHNAHSNIAHIALNSSFMRIIEN